jgi:hypothetical protein
MCGHTASHSVTIHSKSKSGFLNSGNGHVRETNDFLFSLSSDIGFCQCDQGPLKPRFRASFFLEQALNETMESRIVKLLTAQHEGADQ